MRRKRVRRRPALRQLLRDWVDIEGLSMTPGETYIVALQLHRTIATEAELEQVTARLGGLLAEMKKDRLNVKAVILQPGEALKVFSLGKEPLREARPKRKRSPKKKEVSASE